MRFTLSVFIIASLAVTTIQAKVAPASVSSVNLQKRQSLTSPACWLTTHTRGFGHLISECPPHLVQSGLLCYPPCPSNFTGIGPVCWQGLKPKGRGFGTPLGCQNGTEMDNLLCYEKCPKNFIGEGPMCWEQCDPNGLRPHKCGRICTTNKDECTQQTLALSLSGFSIIYGLGTIGAAIAIEVGTLGLASIVGAFGIVAGVGELGSGLLSAAAIMAGYPFCSGGPEKKSKLVSTLEAAKKKYDQALGITCNRKAASRKTTNPTSLPNPQPGLSGATVTTVGGKN